MTLSWSEDEDGGRLEVTGWSAAELAEVQQLDDIAERFAVVPADALAAAGLTPMAGTFSVTAEGVQFQPRLPFAPGTTYAWIDRRQPDTAPLLLERPATSPAPSTVVDAIYPTAAQLPLNMLRFYVHFSAPMSEGCVATAVYLRDLDTESRLTGAILPMDPELWDPTHTRLTVLLDPGRIKRGLAPHEEAGYPLHVGQRVEFVVDDEFRDAAGAPLARAAQRRYVVGPEVHERIRPTRWQLATPRRGSEQPLGVQFERPLDHALAQRCLTLVAASGEPVAGTSSVTPGEWQWVFTPAGPWAASEYTLLIASELEDAAGNSVRRVFDRDLSDPEHNPEPARPVQLSITLR